MNDPDPSVLEKLYHSGAWLCLGIVVAFFALRFASTHVAWLQKDHRAAAVSAILGGLAILVVPATQGTTPNLQTLFIAIGTVVALFSQPKPSLVGVTAPADKTPQGGFVRPGVMMLLALVGFAVLACGADARHDTIATTLHAVDTAEASFLAFDGKHELDIVSASTSHADGQEKLADYRKKREAVNKGFVAAYRAIAAAATLDNDQSVASMVQAAAIIAQELAALGVAP